MQTSLYKKLFSFNLEKDMKISVSDNEIYNQLLLYIFSRSKKNMIVLTSNLNESNKLYNVLKKYYDNTYIFPEDDYLTKKAIAVSPDLLYMRMKLLNTISDDSKKIVICHTNSYIKKLPSIKTFKTLSTTLKIGKSIVREQLIKKLIEIGYKRDTIVSNTGEFSVRGFVIDIFPIDEDHPVRIELFGDEIEKIKYFDEASQMSTTSIDCIEIKPIQDEYDNSTETILDYLDNPVLVIQNIEKINEVLKHIKEQANYYGEELDTKLHLSNDNVYIDLLNNKGNFDLVFSATKINNYNENKDLFIKDIISNNGILYSNNEKFNDYIKNKNIINSNEYLHSGFIFENKYYYALNDLKQENNEINYNIKYKVGKRITSLDNLEIGDYVVHKNHGIGVYMGITTITKNGLMKDYILLQYKGTDKLYLPVEKLEKLYKYSSKDGAKPTLQRLNSSEWDKVKSRIKSKINEISGELIKLYKARSLAKIEPFEEDNDMQKLFESEFEYEPTLDQIKSINDIKKDLESGRPMDRLLCGDVGYGKTEVIFRTIFKTVLNNKQVMYLCPTTLLSQQQYDSAIKRFRNYGVNIEILNRYTPASKVKTILNDLKEGKIDVLFGTHRLLSDDIEPKRLGLLIIDEEQRFGVVHKEKLKKYKNNIHVLSVSATPIPRSLQMSLTGIRDLSLIETAPKNRYPVQTYVIGYDEMLLKEAVYKEVSRGGQVFILYNKISNMDALIIKFRNLMPDINIKYAHGKMSKDEMQDIMGEFYNGKFEVLVSTTIIENGIDIPNANTIIIMNADRFGLSQLYQIRGRVGRSNKIAYAYLMYDKGSLLTETAEKRLNAIKEFTQLGSGYKISMRDLSIRGAGDIIGTEQAGFINSVGVDLYLELINEGLNGITEDDETSAVLIDDVDTHISKKYTSEDELIIEMHDKINSVDSIKKYEEVKSEIVDRYGFIDDKIEMYMTQELVKRLVSKFKINLLTNETNKISMRINDNIYSKLNIEELFVKSININTKFSFVYRNNSIIISLPKIKYDQHYLYYVLNLLLYIDSKVKAEI